MRFLWTKKDPTERAELVAAKQSSEQSLAAAQERWTEVNEVTAAARKELIDNHLRQRVRMSLGGQL